MNLPEANAVHLVTFVVPGSSAEPMDVKVAHSGLRMVLVSRESIGLLDQSWRVLGIYFLLGAGDDPDRYRAYVGEVGKSKLVQRVRQHAGKKDWWSRALLIASSSDEFNSAEIGWLEGRLYDVLNNAVACDVMNGNRPGDESLSLRERGVLERYVEPIMAALRACGAPPDTADQKPTKKGKRTHTHYSESVGDLINAGLLKPETKLHPLRKGLTETATVLADGRLQVGTVIHETLSAAAKAVAGTSSEPGWNFWGAPSGAGGFIPLAKLREKLRENGGVKPAAAPKADVRATTEPIGHGKARELAAEAPPLAAFAQARPDVFPLRIHASYRGQIIEAMVNAAGEVEYDGKTFQSPSAAANDARVDHGFKGATRVRTNGWTWWHFTDTDGTVKELDVLRNEGPARA
jgi:hypothetical protein